MLMDFENFVEQADLELTGHCNLRCVLCANNIGEFSGLTTPYHRPVSEWIRQLDGFKKLKRVFMAGVFSEPTLYRELFQLIEYLNGRQIAYEINTNGCTHDCGWWRELGRMVPSGNDILFTICGSTQKLHEKYRRGSSL